MLFDTSSTYFDMFSVIWFISLYFVIVRRFICSSNLYSSVVVSSSLKKSIYFSNLIQNCFPIHYPDIQSEVEENITEASWLSCGSWGSSASKLEVDVDRVGPRLGDASGASSSTLLLFSPLVAILSEIFFCLLLILFGRGTAVLFCAGCVCMLFGAEHWKQTRPPEVFLP